MGMFGRSSRNLFSGNAPRTEPQNPFSRLGQAPQQPFESRGDSVVNTFRNMLQSGNIDLNSRPQVPMPGGGYATIRSMSFSPDGRAEVLIPTISDDGRVMSEEEAIQTYFRTGRHLGIFRDPASAAEYAERLSDRQGRHYGK